MACLHSTWLPFPLNSATILLDQCTDNPQLGMLEMHTRGSLPLLINATATTSIHVLVIHFPHNS